MDNKKANAKLQKAINKKLDKAREYRHDAQRAENIGDKSLAAIFIGKARKEEAAALELKAQLK